MIWPRRRGLAVTEAAPQHSPGPGKPVCVSLLRARGVWQADTGDDGATVHQPFHKPPEI